MCGRYALSVSAEQLSLLFGLVRVATDRVARFNIAPTQLAPVVRTGDDGRRQLAECRWGLIPPWAKDRKIASRLVNARGETAAEKPAFRDAFRRRRCLVPSDGFYEWGPAGQSQRQPHFIRRVDGQPLVMAGLWESWQEPGVGETVESFTIVTTRANGRIAGLHDRMPVIVQPAAFAQWLGPGELSESDRDRLLEPIGDAWLELFPVSTRVNSPRNDDASLVRPLTEKSTDQPRLFE